MENMHTDMKGQSTQIVCSVHSYRYLSKLLFKFKVFMWLSFKIPDHCTFFVGCRLCFECLSNIVFLFCFQIHHAHGQY